MKMTTTTTTMTKGLSKHHSHHHQCRRRRRRHHHHHHHHHRQWRPTWIRHVTFICDGNACWAKAHHVPSYVGFKQGADCLGQLLEHFAITTTRRTGGKATTSTTKPEFEYVTVYYVSTRNWQRTSVKASGHWTPLLIKALLLLLLLQSKNNKNNHTNSILHGGSPRQRNYLCHIGNNTRNKKIFRFTTETTTTTT
jgi:undecaprenyl pyrophosphate synthase